MLLMRQLEVSCIVLSFLEVIRLRYLLLLDMSNTIRCICQLAIHINPFGVLQVLVKLTFLCMSTTNWNVSL
jgi:hypothetical protein